MLHCPYKYRVSTFDFLMGCVTAVETFILLLFCSTLLGCLLLDISILYALAAGLVIFLLFGRKKGFSWPELFQMCLSGVKTVKNILIIFFLIGLLTIFWRASGTIPVIICYAATLIRPSIFLLMAFLLNCGVSILTGTSFGSAATMGVITMTMANTMQIDPFLVGGAILSGVYFGDRCSPVSTSALLVSTLTQTNIYENIKSMLRSALVPFLATCAIYLVLGFTSGHSGEVMDVRALFSREFVLHWSALLPAAAILLLSFFKVNVKKTMLVSILLALALCFVLQGYTASELLQGAIYGFRSEDPEIAVMLNGGGILSMVRSGAIVCLSSSYAGIFEATGLLTHLKSAITTLSRKITPFGAIAVTSTVAGMVACNQTLTIMLTDQLCHDMEPDKKRFAIHLENSAVVIAPLIPWSIAGAVPIASVGAPTSCILAACFLYLLPLWHWFVSRPKA